MEYEFMPDKDNEMLHYGGRFTSTLEVSMSSCQLSRALGTKCDYYLFICD